MSCPRSALLILLAFIFCAPTAHPQSSPSASPAPSVFTPTDKGRKPSASASDTVRDMYWILNDGTEAEMNRYHSKDYYDHLAKIPPDFRKAMSFDAEASRVTKGHTVTDVEVIKTTYPDYGASVTVCLHFKDGSTQVYNADMAKEDGVWKDRYY